MPETPKHFFERSFKIIILTSFYFLGVLSQEVLALSKEMIRLPSPRLKGEVSLEEVIYRRRSKRQFLDRELSWEQLSQILWAAQGVTGKSGNLGLRACPSAGALYPIEVYILTKEGLYHYLPVNHSLEMIAKKDLRLDLAKASLGQPSIIQAPVNIVICAVYDRVAVKYGQRAIRYADLEAGHVAQNIHLQAEALGLGSVPIGAFEDNKISLLLGLSDKETPLYVIPVGYPR